MGLVAARSFGRFDAGPTSTRRCHFVRKRNMWTHATSTAAARAKRPVGSFYLLFRNYSQFPAAPILLKIIRRATALKAGGCGFESHLSSLFYYENRRKGSQIFLRSFLSFYLLFLVIFPSVINYCEDIYIPPYNNTH